ncbi:hypothetical protein EMIT0373P_30181 [Pseudomonas chlororaphis]
MPAFTTTASAIQGSWHVPLNLSLIRTITIKRSPDSDRRIQQDRSAHGRCKLSGLGPAADPGLQREQAPRGRP